MTTAPPAEFAGTERYEILRRLGSGGMGVVYHAKDRRRNDEIALKTLLRVDASSILHLKTEFRSLADIVHPNLVTLHDLEKHEKQWFFTMGLVRGRTLFEYLKAERHLSAVQAALHQLAEGILALHSMNKLHRDIKPSNVMVDENGRVVILDFGLVTDLTNARAPKGRAPAVGTPWYMAPEQARANAIPTTAADWYAFGVLLFEALTGRLPFEGNMAAVIYKKQIADPPSARELAPELPEDLDQLCMDLLSREPEQRPSGEEVLARLAEPSPHQTLHSSPSMPSSPERRASRSTRDLPTPPQIIGRSRELMMLRGAIREAKSGKLVVARVSGASGIGKSSLVRAVLDEVAADKRAMVLHGRCYQRESVPYKAIDSLIDRLTESWRAMPEFQAAELVPPEVDLVARVFPVLNRVPSVEKAPPTPPIADVQEQRRRTFASLKEILRRIATRRFLVIAIDDLQWGDADSAAMLAELMTMNEVRAPGSAEDRVELSRTRESVMTIDPPACVLMVFTYRAEDVGTSPALRSLIEESTALARVLDIPLAPLGPDDAAELARSLLSHTELARDELVEEIVRESQGGPWLVHELARDASAFSETRQRTPLPTMEAVLARRMSRLTPDARRLLQVVALAGRPVPEPVALGVAAIDTGARDTLALLRADHLLVTRFSAGSDLLETYHDRVRETVVARLTDDDRKNVHLGLGLALEKLGSDPQTLLEHFKGAGDRERSRRYAWESAARADRALAFDQAANLYQVALELEDDKQARVELAGKLGEAQANSGRGRAAAETFIRAGRELRALMPGDDSATQLELRAVEEYLRSGHIDEGVAALWPLSRAQGVPMPKSSAATLFSLGVARAKLKLRGLSYEKRPADGIARESLLRLELCRSAYVGFSLVDPLMSLYFQAQYLLLALEHGEPKSLAISFTGEAIYNATIIGGKKGKARCRELLEIADTLARESGDDYALATQKFQSGSAAYLSADFRRALSLHAEALEILRARCTGVFWEVVAGEGLMFSSLAYLGDVAELARRLPDAMRRADDRGDRFAATGLRIGVLSIGWLAVDRAEHARTQAIEAMRNWPARGYHLQHYLQLVALMQADLYLGSGRLAFERMIEAWPKAQRAQLLRIQAVAIEMRHLKARAALATAFELSHARAEIPVSGKPWTREKLLAVAEEEAKVIAADDLAFSAPFAAALRAALASLKGNKDAAIAELEAAREGFARAEMKLYEACARYARGVLKNDRPEIDAGLSFMRGQHISRPERFVAVLLPGLPVETS